MEHIILSGNLTRDAELKKIGDNDVCSFAIACNRKVKGEERVRFYDLSIWGKRAASVSKFLTKGKRVFVTGEFDTREHDGKTYYQVDVKELDFGGGPAGSGQGSQSESKSGSDDNIPF